jgi:hypothetical protein
LFSEQSGSQKVQFGTITICVELNIFKAARPSVDGGLGALAVTLSDHRGEGVSRVSWTSVVQYQLKLRHSKAQKRKQLEWLPMLASIFNFGVRKIELNARNKVYFLAHDFQNLLAGHSERLGLAHYQFATIHPHLLRQLMSGALTGH